VLHLRDALFVQCLGCGCFLRQIARFDKIAAERADSIGWAFMFTGALRLRFVGENHFADGFATGDGGIEYRHGKLPEYQAVKTFCSFQSSWPPRQKPKELQARVSITIV